MEHSQNYFKSDSDDIANKKKTTIIKEGEFVKEEVEMDDPRMIIASANDDFASIHTDRVYDENKIKKKEILGTKWDHVKRLTPENQERFEQWREMMLDEENLEDYNDWAHYYRGGI